MELSKQLQVTDCDVEPTTKTLIIGNGGELQFQRNFSTSDRFSRFYVKNLKPIFCITCTPISGSREFKPSRSAPEPCRSEKFFFSQKYRISLESNRTESVFVIR